MKKTYNLIILNQKLTIKSDDDEKHVKKVADYVNKRMHEIISGNRTISTANGAILAALNIADDYMKLRAIRKRQTEEWIEEVQGLMGRL